MGHTINIIYRNDKLNTFSENCCGGIEREYNISEIIIFITENKFTLIFPCYRMKKDHVCLGCGMGTYLACCLQKGSLANLTNIEDFLNKH